MYIFLLRLLHVCIIVFMYYVVTQSMMLNDQSLVNFASNVMRGLESMVWIFFIFCKKLPYNGATKIHI